MKRWFVLVGVVLLVSCTLTGQNESRLDLPDETVEITETDVIPLLEAGNISSLAITVEGVRLGDTKRDVTGSLGAPDNFTTFGNMMNYEYDYKNETSIIVHMENNTVTRITLQEPYNRKLVGETVINGSKSDIYRDSGLPDTREIAYRYIIFEYHDEGMEIVTFRGDEFGLSLLPPSRVNESIRMERVKQYIPYSGEIKLQ